MTQGTQDQLKVSFPASPTFTRIGRVAVAGLALRLGIEVAMVEKLRLAVDQTVTALHGPGRVHVQANWGTDELTVLLGNPEVAIHDPEQLAEELVEMVGQATVDGGSVTLVLAAQKPDAGSS